MRVLRSRTLTWPLTPRRKLMVMLAIGFAGSLLVMEALRIAAAATLAQSGRPEIVEEALSLDPSNAEIQHRLGMLRYYSSSPSGSRSGLDALRRATQLDPNEALYWSDLASACESSGNAVCADRATGRALELSPMTPRICWVAANHYLRSDHSERALEIFRRLLDLDPSYAEPAFRVCLRAFGGPQPIADSVIGPGSKPEIRLAFVRFMSAQGDEDAAYDAWQRLAAGSSPPGATPRHGLDANSVAPYLDHLIALGRESEAVAVWADLERLNFIRPPEGNLARHVSRRQRNLIFNEGFETPPLNWGFDWRYEPAPFVAANPSSPAAHSGGHCLRLEFTLPANEECEPTYQVVPVQPNQSYILCAFVRSDRIVSDSGPRLRVLDPFCPVCTHAVTESTVATTPWHRVELGFSAAPQTRFVKISVWRPRSRSYPAEITGQFWLDDVSLVAAGSKESLARSASSESRSLKPAVLP